MITDALTIEDQQFFSAESLQALRSDTWTWRP